MKSIYPKKNIQSFAIIHVSRTSLSALSLTPSLTVVALGSERCSAKQSIEEFWKCDAVRDVGMMYVDALR